MLISDRKTGWIDKAIIKEDRRNLADLTEWFKLIEKLNVNCQERFILAIKSYHRAILLI